MCGLATQFVFCKQIFCFLLNDYQACVLMASLFAFSVLLFRDESVCSLKKGVVLLLLYCNLLFLSPFVVEMHFIDNTSRLSSSASFIVVVIVEHHKIFFTCCTLKRTVQCYRDGEPSHYLVRFTFSLVWQYCAGEENFKCFYVVPKHHNFSTLKSQAHESNGNKGDWYANKMCVRMENISSTIFSFLSSVYPIHCQCSQPQNDACQALTVVAIS